MKCSLLVLMFLIILSVSLVACSGGEDNSFSDSTSPSTGSWDSPKWDNAQWDNAQWAP